MRQTNKWREEEEEELEEEEEEEEEKVEPADAAIKNLIVCRTSEEDWIFQSVAIGVQWGRDTPTHTNWQIIAKASGIITTLRPSTHKKNTVLLLGPH